MNAPRFDADSYAAQHVQRDGLGRTYPKTDLVLLETCHAVRGGDESESWQMEDCLLLVSQGLALYPDQGARPRQARRIERR